MISNTKYKYYDIKINYDRFDHCQIEVFNEELNLKSQFHLFKNKIIEHLFCIMYFTSQQLHMSKACFCLLSICCFNVS